MHDPARAFRAAAIAVVLAGGLAVASCSGGSVANSPSATATAPSTTTTQVIPATGGTLALPAAPNGQAASLSIAAGAPAGVAITATSSTTAPAGAPVPSSVKRVAQSVTGAVPFLFVTFSVSANLSAQYFAIDQVSLLSSNPVTASYYAEFDDLSTSPVTKLGTDGPAALTTGFANFALPAGVTSPAQGTSPTLIAGHTYLIQFYYVTGSGAATPTPTPSPGATATATATATASATAVASASPTPTPAPNASPTVAPFAFIGTSDSTGNSGCTSGGCIPLFPGPEAGITTQVTFSTAPSTTATNIFAYQASGTHPSPQITPSAMFPYVPTSIPGTVEAYYQFSANSAVSFSSSPAVVVSGSPLTGLSGCAFWGYSYNGGAFSWQLIAPVTGASPISGTGGNASASIPAVAMAAGSVQLSSTPFYAAVICQ